MRILIASSYSDRSEAAMYKGLIEAGVDLGLIYNPDIGVPAALNESKLEAWPMKIRHRMDARAVRAFRRLLETNEFDVVYAPWNRSLSVCMLASRGTGLKVIGYRGTMGHLSYWDPASRITYLNPRLSGIVCVSDAVRRYLLSMGLPSHRLAHIYKGHDVSWYEQGPRADLAAFGIPGDAFVVGFVGNMRPVKGVDVLLRSALLLKEEKRVHFLLVGDVHHRKILRLAKDPRIQPRVHLTGFRTDATAIAGACDVFVMPSVEREGLPRAVIEAMAQRVPPVVSDVGGMPEVVVNGHCGLVVPPRDPEALAEAVSTLYKDPEKRRAFGEQARKRVENHFNIRETIRRMMELLERVNAEPSHPL